MYLGVFFSAGFPSIAFSGVVVFSLWFCSGLFSYPGFVLPLVMHMAGVIVLSFYSGIWHMADWLFPCAFKQVVLWPDMS